MTQFSIPKVKVESVEVDRVTDRLKSVVVLVDYRTGVARIELQATADMSFTTIGAEVAARLELHRLGDALARWANAMSRFDPPAPK